MKSEAPGALQYILLYHRVRLLCCQFSPEQFSAHFEIKIFLRVSEMKKISF
jgi:hypothetical protein